MPISGYTRSFVTKDEYKRLLQEAEQTLLREVADYSYKNRIVSAFDGALNSTWSNPANPVKLVKRDRFPSVGGYTPDFLFEFDNGYVLIGEYKFAWSDPGKDTKDLRQLAAYKAIKTTPNPTHPLQPERGHDVLLIVGTSGDEPACEAIAATKGLGAGAVVVAESYDESFRVNDRDHIRLAYRKNGGLNGKFASPNIGPVDSKLDLNYWFVNQRGFAPKCDHESMVEAGECPFVNDNPPEVYSLIEVVLPIVNDLLKEEDRDSLATSNALVISFTLNRLLERTSVRYKRVPAQKMKSWMHASLKELVIQGVAKAIQKGGETHYEITLDDRIQRLTSTRVIERLARGRVGAKYTAYSVHPGTSQLAFEFDPD